MPFKQRTKERSECGHGGNSPQNSPRSLNSLAQLAESSELQTVTLQNLREDLILRADDEEIDDISGGNNLAGGNTLDVESAVDVVLRMNSANDNEKTIPAKNPDPGSQASLIDSLTQVFTSSKKTSPAIAGKIAELVNCQPRSQGFSALGTRLVNRQTDMFLFGVLYKESTLTTISK